jgi:hypothetical protein
MDKRIFFNLYLILLTGKVNFKLSGLKIGVVITIGTLVSDKFLPLFGKIADNTDKRSLIASGGTITTAAMTVFSSFHIRGKKNEILNN